MENVIKRSSSPPSTPFFVTGQTLDIYGRQDIFFSCLIFALDLMRMKTRFKSIIYIAGVTLLLFSSFNSALGKPLVYYDEAGRALIPEIMALSDGEGIPDDIYKKYSTRLIAESVVARLARDRGGPGKLDKLTPRKQREIEESPGIRGGTFALEIPMEAREIHIYRGTKHLKQIVQTGLLNIHQTGTSSFESEFERRSVAENQFAELKISDSGKAADPEDRSNFLRPKYGVLQITSSDYFGADYNLASNQLGPVTAVLKPEVLKRTTYSTEDSLLLYDGEGRTLTKAQLRKIIRPLSDPILYLTTPSQYFEAQVWGELDLRDVLEWRVLNSVRKGPIDILKSTGIPIYRAETENFRDRQMRIRTKLIYAGSPKKYNQYITSLRNLMYRQENKMQSRSKRSCYLSLKRIS